MCPFYPLVKRDKIAQGELVDCSVTNLGLKAFIVDPHQQDLDYVRGFAQGVWFMRKNGHLFETERRFSMLWETLSKIRSGVAQGKLCRPLMHWLKARFKICS
jgi:hypothetical protein